MATPFKYLEPVQTQFVPQYATPNPQLLATTANAINQQVELGRQKYDTMDSLLQNISSETAGLPDEARSYVSDLVSSARSSLDNIVDEEGYRNSRDRINMLSREFFEKVQPFKSTSSQLSEVMTAIDESEADYESKEFLRQSAQSGVVFDPEDGSIKLSDPSRIIDVSRNWRPLNEEYDKFIEAIREKPVVDPSTGLTVQGRTIQDAIAFATEYVMSDPQLRAQTQIETEIRLKNDEAFRSRYLLEDGTLPEDVMSRSYEVEIDGEKTTINPVTDNIISRVSPFAKAYSSLDIGSTASGGTRTSIGNPSGSPIAIPTSMISIANSLSEDPIMNIEASNYIEFVYNTSNAEKAIKESMASYEDQIRELGVGDDVIEGGEFGMPVINKERLSTYPEDVQRNVELIMQSYQDQYVQLIELESKAESFFSDVDDEFESIRSDVAEGAAESFMLYLGLRGAADDVPRPIFSIKDGRAEIENKEEITSSYEEFLKRPLNFSIISDRRRTDNFLEALEKSRMRYQDAYAKVASDVSERKRELQPQHINTTAYLVPNRYISSDQGSINPHKLINQEIPDAQFVAHKIIETSSAGSYVLDSDSNKIDAIDFQNSMTGKLTSNPEISSAANFSVGFDESDNQGFITGTVSVDNQPYRFVLKGKFADEMSGLVLGTDKMSKYATSVVRRSFTSKFMEDSDFGWNDNRSQTIDFTNELRQSALQKDNIESISITKRYNPKNQSFYWSANYREKGSDENLYLAPSTSFDDLLMQIIDI